MPKATSPTTGTARNPVADACGPSERVIDWLAQFAIPQGTQIAKADCDGVPCLWVDAPGSEQDRVIVLGLHLLLFVAPYVALPVAALLGAWGLAAAAAVGVGANLALRVIMALRYGHSPLSVLLHPLAVLAMMGVLLDSFRCSRRGDIRWRGRSYPARSQREAA